MVALQLVLASAVAWAGEGEMENVVLDFTATWCGPCQQVSPIVSRLERQGYPIRKVDVDRNRALAQRMGVESIPCVILMINGREARRLTGDQVSETSLRQLCAMVPAAPAADRASPGGVELGEAESIPSPRKPEPPKEKEPAKAKGGIAGVWPFGNKKPAEPDLSKGPPEMRGKGEEIVPPSTGKPLRGNPLAATVRLRVRDPKGENFGTGTIIDSRIGRTVIITCGHIFREWTDKSVVEVDVFSNGRHQTIVGKRLTHDLKDDVGLITLPIDTELPSCPVAPRGTKVIRGTPVVTVGCSGGDKPTVEMQKVTALNRYLGADNIECTGVPVEGRSGGGLFTKDGLLIGVCNAADPNHREGLYAGIKPIHTILDRCKLTALYRPANGPESPSDIAENETDDDAPVEGAESASRKPSRTLADRGPARQSGGIPADLIDDPELQDALADVGEAEVVCIIRPINQPRAASRVVILNRASSRFVGYLTDELDSQDAVYETTLKAEKKPQMILDVDDGLQPAPKMRQVVGTVDESPVAPRRYQRKRAAE